MFVRCDVCVRVQPERERTQHHLYLWGIKIKF